MVYAILFVALRAALRKNILLLLISHSNASRGNQKGVRYVRTPFKVRWSKSFRALLLALSAPRF